MSILFDPTLYTVPPENCTEREAEVYELLSRLGIKFTSVSHEPAMTIEDCVEIDELLGVPMCKNLLLCDRKQTMFFLVMLPGSKRISSSVLAKAIGAPRLSFAPGPLMEKLLGVSPGSLSVLALKNDTEGKVRLVIDRELVANEFIGCHPCVNTSSLKIKTSDLLRVFLPYTRHKAEIVDLS
jgi:Ala-tRNA(Pro) deacylase